MASFEVGADVINPTSCSIRARDIRLAVLSDKKSTQVGIMLDCTRPAQWNVRLDENTPASSAATTHNTTGTGSALYYLFSMRWIGTVIAKEELALDASSTSEDGNILERRINSHRDAGQNGMGPCGSIDAIKATVLF